MAVQALSIVAIIALGFAVMPFAQHAWALLGFPYDFDPGEGIDVGAAALLLSGGQLYGDPTQFPFFELNYPPVYPIAVAPVLLALGPSVVAGRVVSVASAVGLAVLIFVAASRRVFPLSPTLPRQGGGTSMEGVLGGLAFLASGYVLHVMPLARTTSLMVFLSVAGLLCLERAADLSRAHESPPTPTLPRRGGGGNFWLGIGFLCLLGAVYTKPVALDAVATGIGFLVVRRPEGWGRGLIAAVGLGLAIHVLLQLISGGHYADAVFAANAYPFDPNQLLSFSQNFLETHGLLLALGLMGLVVELRRGEPSPWAFYLGVGLIPAATSGRWGAGESYFFPLIIASCVLGARGLGQLQPGVLRRVGLAALAVYPFLAGPGPWPINVMFPGRDRGFQAEIGYNPGPEDLAAGKRIADFAGTARGPVLSEAAGFLLLGHQPLVANPMLLRGLAAHGQYDASNLVNALRGGRIDRVVLVGFWYPQEVLDTIEAHYERVAQVVMNHNAYLLLRYRGRSS